MYISSVLLFALISARINAVPLNINLGAYSPALVVGDGEISFKGKEEVSQIMEALEGAAVSGAAKNGGSASDGTIAAGTEATDGLGISENASTPSFPSQGMGKTIAPRAVNFTKKNNDKRDIGGFEAALSYASETLGKGPLVELSTGLTGSGHGVSIKPNGKATGQNVASVAPLLSPDNAPVPNNGLGKRDEPHGSTKTTVTRMYVRGGLDSLSEVGANSEGVKKRSITNMDKTNNLNLNFADDELAELTFVETRSIDEEEDDNL